MMMDARKVQSEGDAVEVSEQKPTVFADEKAGQAAIISSVFSNSLEAVQSGLVWLCVRHWMD